MSWKWRAISIRSSWPVRVRKKRREEQTKKNERANYEKITSFQKKKNRKQGETGGGYMQCWWRAVADSSLWGNEMIIRVLTGKWTAIVALKLGVIIDFLLC